MKSQKLIYVNPVERPSVQGRDQQVYTLRTDNGEIIPLSNMRKSKEFGVAEVYAFPYNPQKNRLETGLDEMVLNPFQNNEVSQIMDKYALDEVWVSILERLVKEERIKKQTYYEIMAGVKPDFYTSEVGATIFNMGQRNLKDLPRPTFLQQFKITLYPRPNNFVDDGTAKTSRGRLAMLLIDKHPKIADNKGLVNSALHNWFVSEENEAEEEMNKRQNFINKAIYNLYKLQNEDTEYRNYQVGILLKDFSGKQIMKGKLNFTKVKEIMNKFITDTSKHQVANCDSFMKVVELLDTVDGSEKFAVKYLVQQAINANVIAIRDGYFVWHSKAGSDENVYKNSHYDKLISLLLKEYETYNPKDESLTNWYKELYDEVKSKGVWLEEL
jgi:hypothetical protein